MKAKLLIQANSFSADRYYLIAILLNSFLSGLIFSFINIAIPSHQLVEAQCSLTMIGAFVLTNYPYSFKILWAPFIDRYTLPFLGTKLGKRRGWAMAAQICLVLALLSLNLLDISPAQPLPITAIAVILFITAFFAATQDMVWEAYRLERPATKEELSLAIGFSTTGFRLGMFIGSAVVLDIAAKYGWHQVYQIVFLVVHIGPIITLCIKEPNPSVTNTLKNNHNYFHIVYKSLMVLKGTQRYVWLSLLFLLLYKSNDIIPMIMGPPLFHHLAFTKEDIAFSKKLGYIGLIIGSSLSSTLTKKVGIYRSICMNGIIQLLAPFMLMLLALIGRHHMPLLSTVMVVQYFISGLSTTALTIYFASLCTGKWKATQHAIIASINSQLRVLLSFGIGFVAEHMAWPKFFLSIMLLGIIAIMIFPRIYYAPLTNDNKS